jgi:toxoflavin biosynthesis protein ToxD
MLLPQSAGHHEETAHPVVAVPAGSFLMGSDQGYDNQADRDELPQHTVMLEAYHISIYPLIVAEYACFLHATQRPAPRAWLTQVTERIDCPVVGVSWHDAVAYAHWLTQATDDDWRLPSEAEWEKAARGTDGRIYPWGNQWDKTKANAWDGRGSPNETTPVGAYPQGTSPYGVQDMSGNVWEWTSTDYQPYPYQANDGREDLSRTARRVLRGGSCRNYHQYARAACRYLPSGDTSFVGGRLMCGSVVD